MFRVVVSDDMDSFAANSLTYDSIDEAYEWGYTKAMVWYGMKAFAVISTDIKPDYKECYWSLGLIDTEGVALRYWPERLEK